MTPDQDLIAPQIEWPDEIWALERGEHDMRGEHVYEVFATVARWEGDREGQYHRYVDGDTLDSLKKYHAALIDNGQLITLADHERAVQAAVADAKIEMINSLKDEIARQEGAGGEGSSLWCVIDGERTIHEIRAQERMDARVQAAVAKAVEDTLDAAHEYTNKTYNMQFLSYPVDRQRIAAAIRSRGVAG